MSGQPDQTPPHTVADHLLDRLAAAGVEHAFGVPGDYSLRMLDHVIRHDQISWVGCTNELNAGYAADAYGRLRGVAALFTTFGVGELSAVNALAGSFAEYVPVVHVVGAPSLTAQSTRRALHHTLGDGEFSHFLHMHQPVTCAQAALTAENAVSEIDRVLTAVLDQHLPGYLLVPADIAELPVPAVAEPLPRAVDPTDPAALRAFVDAASRLFDDAGQDVSVLVGLLAHRFGAVQELDQLLHTRDLPHATTVWAKSLVDETHPGFRGTYAGAASAEATRKVVEDAGALVLAGVQFTDLNSGMFTHRIDAARTVDIAARSARVGAATFAPIELPTALRALTGLLRRGPAASSRPSPEPAEPLRASCTPVAMRDAQHVRADSDLPLNQAGLWDAVAAFLRPRDLVIADQGTAFYGMAVHQLPTHVTFVGQPLWASIGYALPATLGACLAAPGRRAVLLIGDGAAQMTAQELSTILHARLPVVMIVVDNDGYSVERAIHGPAEAYNDIAHWDWTQAPRFFGSDVPATRVATPTELHEALDAAQHVPDLPALIQAVVPRDDVPDLLERLTTILARSVRVVSGTDAPTASARPTPGFR